MKQKLLMMLAALMMLTGTSAMAQSETLKGDVNGDGAVDVADIAAVIQIMKDNGDIETKYYWYVGQENPADMTSISPIVTDNTSPGWRLIGTSIPTYDKANPLWTANDEIEFDSKNTIYIALPSDNIKYRNDITGADITSEAYEIQSTKKTINGVQYTILTSKKIANYWGVTLY
ncbi:MAG: hypothetical protein J6R12_06260 [Bacteroidales bacterium]|nr:hypothetical protein [Bacteroidales bacterium]